MKRVVILLTVFFVSLALAAPLFAAGGQEGGDDEVVIGISVGTLKEERWMREVEMWRQYAADNGFSVNVQTAEGDALRQVSQIENLITQGVDALIVQAQNSKAAGPAGDKAREAGIPIVSYERLVQNGHIDYHVGFDAKKVGIVQAQVIVDLVPEGNYIWLNGGPEEALAHYYLEGQTEVLQPYIDRGDINIVLHEWCKGWSPEEALKHAENGLAIADNDVQAVIASNDNTAGGAISALASQGLAGQVPISGQDANLAAAQRIMQGTQAMTVYKELIKLNTASMQLAYALATGAEDPAAEIDSSLGRWTTWDNGAVVADTFLVDVTPVTADNMCETIVADGFHPVEKVFEGIPQSEWPEECLQYAN